MNIRIETDIQKAVVVGAGAMGSGIAAHLANAGITVHLLDIVPKSAVPPPLLSVRPSARDIKDSTFAEQTPGLQEGTSSSALEEDRSSIAKNAIQRMLKATPGTNPLDAGFMVPENAKRVIPGNTEDHLETAVREADWIIEAVIEDLSIKQALFEKLEIFKKPEAIVSSNTSTIPLHDLTAGRTEAFKKRFIITHFFNPPRFMHLLEVVGGDEADPSVIEAIRKFGDLKLGKNVIVCKDTPAFLANRIGIYYMLRGIVEARQQNISIQAVDTLLGTPMGYPKEGIFGLLDLVGIGIIPLVTESLLKSLPPHDHFRSMDYTQGLALIQTMIQEGRTGRKSPKGGFYRMQKQADGSKQKQALNLTTGDYEPVEKLKLRCAKAAKAQGPRAIFQANDDTEKVYRDYAWVVMRDTLLYAAGLIPEITDDIADLDAAMRDGYNAEWGPFQLIDRLGIDWFSQKLTDDGLTLPLVIKMAENRSFYKEEGGKQYRLAFDFKAMQAEYRELTLPEGVIRLRDIKRASKPLITHYSASLWDIGDGVTCLEFHSKMNTLDPSVLWVINQSIEFITQNSPHYRAMVIYNEGKNFSLGANLGLLEAGLRATKNPWLQKLSLAPPMEHSITNAIESMVYHGQSIFKALRDAPFPVIGAPHGMALGGGCEILLHCDAIQAAAETYMGLVESGVGLIPAWGGCTRYLERCRKSDHVHAGPVPPVREAFQAILLPQLSTSTSAFDAKVKHWLKPGDGITMNPDRLLADAKARALTMAEHYTPPAPATYRLPGPGGKAALSMALDDFYFKGDATFHDVVTADALADVLSGGDTHTGQVLTESDIAQMERENFISLLRTPQTQKRIAHTLKTGKPLREEIQPLPDDPSERTRMINELRASRQHVSLTKRPITGRPLQGAEARKLRAMAVATAWLLRQFGGS